jgi:hypothetical protein
MFTSAFTEIWQSQILGLLAQKKKKAAAIFSLFVTHVANFCGLTGLW